MRMVERTTERVVFRCPACDDIYTGIRCLGRARTRGGRDGIGSQCNGIALFGYFTCKAHQNDELLGLVGSDR